MSLNYGVLKAQPIESLEGTAHSPHYQIHVVDPQSGTHYRIAVNVLSQVQPYNLQYHVIDDFKYPTLATLQGLPDGFTKLESKPGGLAIDFLRSDIVDEDQMRPVLFTDTGSETQLNDLLHERIQDALADSNARIYAFGDHWGPQSQPDQYFHFQPGNGIHDIHMNQGNDPGHRSQDGVWQDGALMVFLPATNRWMAVFLKFQSQSVHTDNAGHATDSPTPSNGGGGGYGGQDDNGGQGGHHHHHHHHSHS